MKLMAGCLQSYILNCFPSSIYFGIFSYGAIDKDSFGLHVHLIPISISIPLVNRYCNASYSSPSSLLFVDYF